MEPILYAPLTRENFESHALDSFVRRQAVTECWRRVDGALVLRPVAYVEDCTLDERRAFAAELLETLGQDRLAFGAFAQGELVGYAVLPTRRLGNRGQYIDLAEFYVSEPCRNRGIGRRLFQMACENARVLGAERLYISAHSAKETIAAYRSFGCVEAEEIDRALAEKEPCDVQMEYRL